MGRLITPPPLSFLKSQNRFIFMRQIITFKNIFRILTVTTHVPSGQRCECLFNTPTNIQRSAFVLVRAPHDKFIYSDVSLGFFDSSSTDSVDDKLAPEFVVGVEFDFPTLLTSSTALNKAYVRSGSSAPDSTYSPLPII